jgi:hypothetical protein
VTHIPAVVQIDLECSVCGDYSGLFEAPTTKEAWVLAFNLGWRIHPDLQVEENPAATPATWTRLLCPNCRTGESA